MERHSPILSRAVFGLPQSPSAFHLVNSRRRPLQKYTRILRPQSITGRAPFEVQPIAATAIAFLASGGDGCISVTANVAPRLCAEMQDAWQEGRVKDAMAIQNRLVPLHDALFAETSPAPVKFAASLLGKTSERCRLPLAPIMEGTRAKVRAAMTEVGLLN